MWDVFFSIFVIAALALMFAHAWNLFAETLLATWEIRDSTGNVKAPVLQTFVYAIVMTIISIALLWFIHYYIIDLSQLQCDNNGSTKKAAKSKKIKIKE